jgi:hypothetical protein
MTPQQAYADGRAAAERITAAGRVDPTNDFLWARTAYQGAEDLDLAGELISFARERMASEPDLTRYPECRGLRDVVEAERKGFASVIQDPLVQAYHFDWYWFVSRRLNTRFVGKTPPPAHCTDFWFADTREGGPIHGSNRDDVLFRYKRGFASAPTKGAPDETFPPPGRITGIGGVSAAVLCDEEPECLFPVNLDWVMPAGVTDIREHVGYLERYREFWGPGNQILVDPQMNFVCVEKANVRMGVRYSTGCAAITACAYLTPGMNAFKKERDLLSFKARGWGRDNPDAAYWAGAERRYRRLLDLVRAEQDRGATLIGAAEIALDHAVPFPDRICIAGEKGHPDEQMQNWTLQSFARCVSGPNRRMLYWLIDPEDPKPVYTTKCCVIPGLGLESRRAEWEQEAARAGEIGLHPAR